MSVELTIIPPSELPDTAEKQVADDAELVRKNLHSIVKQGHSALEQIWEVADQSGMPEAYEALASMIKTMTAANRELMNLHKSKKALSATKGPSKVQNNLVVCSTTELQKMLDSIGEKK